MPKAAKSPELSDEQIFKLPALGDDMLFLNKSTGNKTLKGSGCIVDSIILADMSVVWSDTKNMPVFEFSTDVTANAYGKPIRAGFTFQTLLRVGQKTHYCQHNNMRALFAEVNRFLDKGLENKHVACSRFAWARIKERVAERRKSGTMFKILHVVTYNPVNHVVCLWKFHNAYGVNKMVLHGFKTHSSQKRFTAVSPENEHLWEDLAGKLKKCECESLPKEPMPEFECAMKALNRAK